MMIFVTFVALVTFGKEGEKKRREEREEKDGGGELERGEEEGEYRKFPHLGFFVFDPQSFLNLVPKLEIWKTPQIFAKSPFSRVRSRFSICIFFYLPK